MSLLRNSWIKPNSEQKIDFDDIAVEFSSEDNENENDNQIRYAMPEVNMSGESKKSKLAAGLLGIFLGGLGVHNFYLGYTKKAVIQLVLYLVGCCTFSVSTFASVVWGFIEGILILTGNINIDGDGNALGK